MIDNSGYELARQIEQDTKWTSDFYKEQWNRFDQNQKEQSATSEILALKNKVKAYEELLSRPMHEIAQVHEGFQKTYEIQQQMLAEWILAQRAYKETATSLGLKAGKTAEEVQQQASANANAVLENRTEHGNDAKTNPILSTHADAILALRKKNGKA